MALLSFKFFTTKTLQKILIHSLFQGAPNFSFITTRALSLRRSSIPYILKRIKNNKMDKTLYPTEGLLRVNWTSISIPQAKWKGWMWVAREWLRLTVPQRMTWSISSSGMIALLPNSAHRPTLLLLDQCKMKTVWNSWKCSWVWGTQTCLFTDPEGRRCAGPTHKTEWTGRIVPTPGWTP